MLRHPACSSLSASARGAVARFLQHAWFLGLGPFSSSIPCRETGREATTVPRYKCTMPLYSPRQPSYTVNAPTSPYSRPHEPTHLLCILQKLHFQQISCTSQRLHPPRFPRTPDSSLFDSSTRLERQRHAARPNSSSSLPKHTHTRERSHLRHHHTQPRIQQPQPSAPSCLHSIWQIWRLKFQAPVICQLPPNQQGAHVRPAFRSRPHPGTIYMTPLPFQRSYTAPTRTLRIKKLQYQQHRARRNAF